jgi:hypothetical protein
MSGRSPRNCVAQTRFLDESLLRGFVNILFGDFISL